MQLTLRLLATLSLIASVILITAEVGKEGVIISVADHRPGIAEAEQSRIFEKFYRRSKDHSTVRGTGMGRATARELLRAQGGSLWLKSISGQGSEFSCSLPITPKEGLA